MKSSVCRHPGCYRTASAGSRYCPLHAGDGAQRRAGFGKSERTRSAEWHRLYECSLWRRTSREFLARYPFCCVCGKPAQIADHIRPHRGDEALFYDESNLQPLCRPCHSAKTLAENNFFRDRRNPAPQGGMGVKKN